MCLSAQSSKDTRYNDKGQAYDVPVRFAANAVSLKSFFLDVDVKDPAKGYATREDARAAIDVFVATVGLPQPNVVVDSGNGFHVYWTLIEPVKANDWLPWAYALSEACKANGLKCDTQCTIDSARILRIPGTFNHKTTPPHPVALETELEGDYPLSMITDALEPYIGKVSVPAQVTSDFAVLKPRPGMMGAVENELGAGIEVNKAPPVDMSLVAAECPFFMDALADGGATNPNPLWVLCLLAAAFCGDDGRDLAHAMSHGHPAYTVEETDMEYERKVREREARNLGWPSCKAISGAGATQCQSCAHFSKGKSPLLFGMPQVTLPGNTPTKPLPPGLAQLSQAQGIRQQAMNVLPPNYTRKANGLLYRVTMDDTGNQTEHLICPYPIWDGWLQRNPWVLNFSTMIDGHTVEKINLRYEDMSAKETFRKSILRFGVMLEGDAMFERLQVFFMAWVNTLREGKLAIGEGATFGWLTKGSIEEGFIYNGTLFTSDGEHRPMAVADPVIADQYKPKGELAPWQAACDIIVGHGRHDLEAIIASAFAAPLIKFTGHSGLIMAAYSEASGRGKTTAMKIAQSVWGDPKRALQQLDDTQNAVFKKIGQIKNLPMYWDEIKGDENLKNFVRLIFAMSSGKEKSRMRSDTTMNLSGTWKTLLVSANNDSLIDFIIAQTKQTKAGLMRVFEYEVTSMATGDYTTSMVQAMIGELDENYGVVGREYAEFLGSNWKEVQQDVLTMGSTVEAEQNATTDERFWCALISVLLVGAEYANALGFTKIDLPGLKGFLYSAMKNMRNVGAAQPVDMDKGVNVVNIIARFLADKRARNTLVTNRMHVSRGKPAANSIQVLSNPARLEAVHVHMSRDDGLMRVVSSAFSEWCSEHGISRHQISQQLQKQFSVREVNGIIGSGTEFASMTQYCLQFDMNDMNLKHFIE